MRASDQQIRDASRYGVPRVGAVHVCYGSVRYSRSANRYTAVPVDTVVCAQSPSAPCSRGGHDHTIVALQDGTTVSIAMGANAVIHPDGSLTLISEPRHQRRARAWVRAVGRDLRAALVAIAAAALVTTAFGTSILLMCGISALAALTFLAGLVVPARKSRLRQRDPRPL